MTGDCNGDCNFNIYFHWKENLQMMLMWVQTNEQTSVLTSVEKKGSSLRIMNVSFIIQCCDKFHLQGKKILISSSSVNMFIFSVCVAFCRVFESGSNINLIIKQTGLLRKTVLIYTTETL